MHLSFLHSFRRWSSLSVGKQLPSLSREEPEVTLVVVGVGCYQRRAFWDPCMGGCDMGGFFYDIRCKMEGVPLGTQPLLSICPAMDKVQSYLHRAQK